MTFPKTGVNRACNVQFVVGTHRSESGSGAIMTQVKHQGWARTLKMGQSEFVWKFGILGWGFPTAILWSLLISNQQGSARLFVLLPIALILFPIGGFAFGRILWAFAEFWHRRTTETPKS